MQPDSSGLNSILCQLFTLQDESHQLLLGLTFSENFDVKKQHKCREMSITYNFV